MPATGRSDNVASKPQQPQQPQVQRPQCTASRSHQIAQQNARSSASSTTSEARIGARALIERQAIPQFTIPYNLHRITFYIPPYPGATATVNFPVNIPKPPSSEAKQAANQAPYSLYIEANTHQVRLLRPIHEGASETKSYIFDVPNFALAVASRQTTPLQACYRACSIEPITIFEKITGAFLLLGLLAAIPSAITTTLGNSQESGTSASYDASFIIALAALTFTAGGIILLFLLCCGTRTHRAYSAVKAARSEQLSIPNLTAIQPEQRSTSNCSTNCSAIGTSSSL